jgi:molecular chaperone GrpE
MSKAKKKKEKDPETLPPAEEQAASEAVEEPVAVETAEDWREKYLRALAELDNFRKRSERDREQMRRYSLEGALRSLLPVLDSLAYARDAEGDAEDIREGLALVLSDALRILGDLGVEPIDALDEPFDPRFHEAVGVLPDTERAQGTIVVEERRGYRLHDRVLRPSRVHISIRPPEPEAEESDAGEEDRDADV